MCLFLFVLARTTDLVFQAMLPRPARGSFEVADRAAGAAALDRKAPVLNDC
jgi:hypothetical protein